MKLLLEKGAAVDADKLIVATYGGHLEVVKLLLGKTVPIGIR